MQRIRATFLTINLMNTLTCKHVSAAASYRNDRKVAFQPVFRAIDNCRKFREGGVPKSNGRMN
ncbi:hypothetical protein EMIT0P260_50020 [Pseudomonas sp. IT-P260]